MCANRFRLKNKRRNREIKNKRPVSFSTNKTECGTYLYNMGYAYKRARQLMKIIVPSFAGGSRRPSDMSIMASIGGIEATEEALT